MLFLSSILAFCVVGVNIIHRWTYFATWADCSYHRIKAYSRE